MVIFNDRWRLQGISCSYDGHWCCSVFFTLKPDQFYWIWQILLSWRSVPHTETYTATYTAPSLELDERTLAFRQKSEFVYTFQLIYCSAYPSGRYRCDGDLSYNQWEPIPLKKLTIRFHGGSFHKVSSCWSCTMIFNEVHSTFCSSIWRWPSPVHW